jgi:hypothetical protein
MVPATRLAEPTSPQIPDVPVAVADQTNNFIEIMRRQRIERKKLHLHAELFEVALSKC